MTSRIAVLAAVFALAFAVGRYVPQERRAPSVASSPSLPEDARSARGTRPSARPVSHNRPPLLLPSQSPGSTTSAWMAHVARDPTHHAMDAQRISRAVFSNEAVISALDECTPLFAPVESKLRLRTTISISRESIEISGVESVEVLEGLELSTEARACVLEAFHPTSTTKPTHPDVVQPYHGPYDLFASVVGAPIPEAKADLR